MATYYVSSVAGDNGAGTTWATAKTSVAAGLALATSTGDIVYVDSAHSFTASAASIAWNVATSGIAVSIISVDRNGSTTTGHNGWLAGAAETVDSGDYSFAAVNTTNGTMFVYGLTITQTAGSGNNKKFFLCSVGGIGTLTMQSCTLTNHGTSIVADFQLGTGPSSNRSNLVVLKDCLLNLKNASASSSPAILFTGGRAELYGTTIGYSGANKPLRLFGPNTSGSGELVIADCDLSGYNTSGGALFDVGGSNTETILRNVKISATPAITVGTPTLHQGSITMINVDSGDTKTVFQYRNMYGTVTSGLSIYKSASGATFAGSGVSWGVVTTSSCTESSPFICPWLMSYSSATAEITVGLRIVHDSATAMHDRNLWSEVEYVSSSTFPQGTLAGTRNAQPFDGSTSNWTADSDSWEGTGGFANANKQKVNAVVTPGEGSLIRGRLIVGATSKTLYLDPKLSIA
jgi:hypothetical protein